MMVTDLTPCDFFVWQWANENVYQSKQRTLLGLEVKIQNFVQQIPNEVMKKAIEDVPKILRKCINNTTGSRVEV